MELLRFGKTSLRVRSENLSRTSSKKKIKKCSKTEKISLTNFKNEDGGSRTIIHAKQGQISRQRIKQHENRYDLSSRI